MLPSGSWFSYQSVSRGSIIYREGDPTDTVYFLKEGRIKIGLPESRDREIIKMVVEQGHWFGEMALIHREARRDRAVALQAGLIGSVPADHLRGILQRDTRYCEYFVQLIGRRQLDMEYRVNQLTMMSSQARIVQFLIDLVQKEGQRIGLEWVVYRFYPQQIIRGLTDTSRQTVSRVLNDLRRKNIITFDKKRLLVRDLDALMAERNR